MRSRPTAAVAPTARGSPRGARSGAGADREQRCWPGELRDRVTRELKLGRSPEAIWADLMAEGADSTVGVETIYAAVYAGALDVKARDCLRMRRPRRRGRQARHPNQRPALHNIAARPGAVGDRTEPGHWEADHLIGRANASALMCLTERVSRYSLRHRQPTPALRS